MLTGFSVLRRTERAARLPLGKMDELDFRLEIHNERPLHHSQTTAEMQMLGSVCVFILMHLAVTRKLCAPGE